MSIHESRLGIAIIGLGCRFPQAHNPEAFWRLISEGRTVFQAMPEVRKMRHAHDGLDKIRAGFLENPYLFDNSRFNIPDSEALVMDPQQRLMLELSVEAMEDAGYSEWSNQAVGVFVGANQLAYQEMISSRWYRQKAMDHLLESDAFQRIPLELRNDLQDELSSIRSLDNLSPNALVGILANMIPGRIAHELNLKGPAFSIDTACSSSLVAVHLACESLYRYECDMALSGGVNLNLTPAVFHYMQAAGVISPTDKCIPFSKESNGILLGEGAGMVALKRLEDAMRDKDPVWAVIRGSGINNDGRSLGLMAPAWKGQLALLQKTYADSGFDPARISAIEAHGTSTRIGDGVELSVIEKFFPLNPAHPISVGSVKSNLGHTLGTAGIASLIKMVLAIRHRQLPPSIHEEIDPAKNLVEKGIQIQSGLTDWKSDGLRAACVNSFGFGGTNAHLILEEPESVAVTRPAPVTVFSRKSFCFDFFPQLQPTKSIFTTLQWEEEGQLAVEKPYHPACWLLFGFVVDELQKLRDNLAKKGMKTYCVHCSTAEKSADFTRSGEYDFVIDASNAEHYRWLLASFPSQEEIGVLYLGNGSSVNKSPVSLIRHEMSGFRFLLRSLKQWGRAKIWVVTFGAFKLKAAEHIHPWQRAMSALAMGALEENPDQRGMLIDLDASEPDLHSIIYRVLGVVESRPIVLRKDRIYAPLLKPAKSNYAPISIKPGGIYLVLGGSSGLGALVAEHLAGQSARKVIVSGTRAPEQLPESLLALMPERVAYVQCSTTDRAALTHLIDDVYATYDKVDGIIYAAGRIAPGSLANKTQEDFEKVLFAKIAGVEYLAECLKDRNPGFVYLISSISGLTPSWARGMADYAAANAFLDASAVKHHSTDTPWISCSWGPWEKTGMAKTLGDQIKGFSPQEGLDAFMATLSLGLPNVIALPAAQQASFTTEFSATTQHTGVVAVPDPVTILPIETPVEEIYPRRQPGSPNMSGLLKQFIAEAVEMPPEDLDENASFYQLGLDSLSAVDVAQKIEAQTGLTLHPTILFEHDTIHALGKYLENQQSGNHSPQRAPEPDKLDLTTTNRFPLIGAQHTFYAQQQFHPDKPCNVLVNLLVEKPLNMDQLQDAWKRLIVKHDALRLSFEMTDQGPMQFTMLNVDAPILFREFNDNAEVLTFENELVNQVFDLGHPPFFRLAHVSWPTGNTALMLMMHHLIFDAWSMYVLLKELIETYEQAASGENTALPQPGRAFEEYVQFHEKNLLRKDFSSLKAFWTKTLDQAVWGLPLPYRKERGQQSRYRMVVGALSKLATEQWMQQSQEHRLSDFHTILAAYFLTLQRHTGRDDMIIRVANANRDAIFLDIESLTGCLADALPLRVRIHPGDDLTAVAQNVKQQMLDALRHTGLSSQDIAELPIGRQDEGPVVLSPVGLSFVPMHHLSKSASFQFNSVRCRTALPFTDISLICFIENNVFKCCWNFDEALFEPQDIEQIKDTFLQILGGSDALNHPLPSLGMPAAQLFPEFALLHEKVWAACERYGQREAVVSNEGTLSYQALAIQSKQLANTLITQLSEEEDTVGIFAYPGLMATVGLTGIPGSGRAFIPLDPDWPAGRIESILTHAGCKTIVTTASLLPQLLEHPPVKAFIDCVVLLDEMTGPKLGSNDIKVISIHGASAAPLSDAPVTILPRHLAYIMYTSGTSGNPKGVMVSHEAVEVFLNWVSETFRIQEDDRFIHTSSLGFGGSIRQVFSTLLAGATIYPIARTKLKDPQELFHFLRHHRITLLNTVPTVINNLLEWVELSGTDTLKNKPLKHLRFVLLGGESLYAETVVKWRRHFGKHSAIVNLYGSTETIVNATFYITPLDAPVERGVVPIGHQKKGSLVRLINENGVLCAPGEVGQILVGGPCLASGYYREPALTAQKFIRLDLPGTKGIFYSTGDLAQADTTGLVHFMGRNDDQIQLYGNRIELTEIEDAIYQTHQVKNTAVVDFRSETQHRIVAFVELTKTGIKLSAEQIRDFIAQRLPAYMVPHQVILLETIPLNQAGKTDRAALRLQLADGLSEAADTSGSTAVMSPTESKIATVWQKLLHISAVKSTDDFFRLGGDSIMALEMLHHLRKHFQILPKAFTVFKDRQLYALAESIDRLNSTGHDHVVSAPLPEVKTNKNALSPSQKGFVLLRKLIPTSSPNWAGILQFQGKFDTDRLTQAFDFLLRRHPMLRTVFLTEGAQTWQQILDNTKAPVEIFDISGQSPDQQQKLLEAAFVKIQNTAFDLSQYPLFRVQLYQTGDRSGALAICMHHIITDGWSTHILTNDLLRVYDQIMEGKIPHLDPKPPMYAEAVPLLSGTLPGSESPSSAAHLAYWERILSDMPAFNPPSSVDNTARSVTTFILPASTREQLIGWSKANGVTLYNLLLALNARALMQLYHLQDLLINTAVSGRDLPLENIQHIVGCFARNLPLRIALEEDSNLLSDVKTVENVFFEALEHQDVPPTALFKIATRTGNPTAIFSVNRFYFSFMDFSALEKHTGRHLSLLWDQSTFSFSAGGAGSEIMMGVDVSDMIRINLNGYASSAMKERLKSLLLDAIVRLTTPTSTIDTALIAYLPGKSWLKALLPQVSSGNGLDSWKEWLIKDQQPKLLEHVKTPFGVSGVIFLPLDADELRAISPEKRTQEILKALHVAHGHGARHVSMAGILPALTNYGYTIAKAMRDEHADVASMVLTTGHACTVAAVVKTVEKVLVATERHISHLKVAVIGFGSIGQASLALMLQALGHPAELIIVDLEAQLSHLIQPLADLKASYTGKLTICLVKDQKMPDDLYDADLVIGASSTGQLLEVNRFRPGAVLVDDSFPPVIDVQAGIRRMQQQADVLLLGGGKLKVCDQQHHHLAPEVPESIMLSIIRNLGDEGMPGCRMEPLIMRNAPELPPTLGLAEPPIAWQYWEKINALCIDAVPLHLGGFTIPESIIKKVRILVAGKTTVVAAAGLGNNSSNNEHHG